MADDCPVFDMDPLDKRIINIDFGTWLGASPTILSAAWVVPAGLTAADQSETSTVATNYFTSTNGDQDEYEVACTITTNEAVVLKSGSLSSAVRASMSVPAVFATVKLDGHILVDGGSFRGVL